MTGPEAVADAGVEAPRRFNPLPWLLGVIVVLILVIAAYVGQVTARDAAGRFVSGLAIMREADVSATWEPVDQSRLLSLHHQVFGVSRTIRVQGIATTFTGLEGLSPAFTVKLANVPLDDTFQGAVVDVSMRLTLDGWRVGGYSTVRPGR